jgi:hypothetical protein
MRRQPSKVWLSTEEQDDLERFARSRDVSGALCGAGTHPLGMCRRSGESADRRGTGGVFGKR